jgi:hypothetical protein
MALVGVLSGTLLAGGASGQKAPAKKGSASSAKPAAPQQAAPAAAPEASPAAAAAGTTGTPAAAQPGTAAPAATPSATSPAGGAGQAGAQGPGATAAPAAGATAAPTDGTTAPADGATGPGQGVTGSAYTVKLHDLERRVNELKEQIFRSKARLNIMKETVLQGRIGGSRSLIMHRNEMSSTYSLIKLVYALDGAEIYAKADDTGHLGDTQEFEIFNGSTTPGKHTVSVRMIYQGNGYGVFAYLKGYKATVDKTCTFSAEEGRQTQLKLVAFEKGNPVTTDWDKRPNADCRVTITSDKPAGAAGVAGSAGPAGSGKSGSKPASKPGKK